jgi:hypothetical protein
MTELLCLEPLREKQDGLLFNKYRIELRDRIVEII